MATASLLMCTGRRRNGCTGPAEPWFALNRSVYQAILNVALAEMTSASPSAAADCIGSGIRFCEDSHKAGSELLRLLLSDEESNRLKLSSAMVEPSDKDQHTSMKSRQDNDELSDDCESKRVSLPPLIPIEDSKRSVLEIDCKSSDTERCTADSGDEKMDNDPSNEVNAHHVLVPKVEVDADCDRQSSNVAESANRKSPCSAMLHIESSTSTCGDGTLTSHSVDDDDDGDDRPRCPQISSEHPNRSPTKWNFDPDRTPPTSGWIPIDKNFVTSIVNRQLYQTSSTPVVETTVRKESTPVEGDWTNDSGRSSSQIDNRSRLLADLLRQTDDITSCSMTAARKRQSLSVVGPETSPLTKTDDRLPTKKSKCSPDEEHEVGRHLFANVSSSSNGRVHVRSTWPVPGTADRRFHGQDFDRVTSRQMPSQLLDTSRRLTGSLLGTSPASSRDGSRILSCRQSPVSQEYSQVWTAVNKTVVLDVIDQLLDLDFDDVIDVEDSAIDLTVVRRPSGDKTSGTALNVPSKRDLLAFFSQGSTGYRTRHSHQHQYATHRQTFTTQRRKRNHLVGQAEISSENQNGGEFRWRVVEVGSDEDEETSSQFKWKSNIMRRLRKEQTTVGARGAALGTPSDNSQVWRRGASSIAATGS